MKIRDKTGKWLDSSVFRKEALKFQKSGVYNTAPAKSPDWRVYWDEQLRRCKEGYSVYEEDGTEHKVTGNHYMYLNFSQLESVVQVKGSKASKKITIQPDFWDGDYDYFWSMEIARFGLFGEDSQIPTTDEEYKLYLSYAESIERIKDTVDNWRVDTEYKEIKIDLDKLNAEVLSRLKLKVKPHPDYLDGGYHMVVGKSRRKGYSFKNAAICANVYNTRRAAQIVIGASDKKFLYPKGTMGMSSTVINFLNKHTAWRKSRDYVDKQDHRKASYKRVINGNPIESGYQSEMFALTFKDNPDAARGKDAYICLLEEAGAFPNLQASFAAIKPALTSGTYITGQIIIFGTGGDMESGTVDFADMFYNPESNDMMPFINIWDKDAENSVCGFFHPVTWNMEGCYDKQGNSNIEKATKFEMERRDKIRKKSSSSSTLNQHTQEFPFCPSEAFLTVTTNNFPVIELRRQLDQVVREGLNLKKGTPSFISYEKGEVVLKPDLKRELEPILHYTPKVKNLDGCPMIFEYPVDNPPRGLYKIGYDPYRQDKSTGVSLASIYVYKTLHLGSFRKNIIVAEYVGRPEEADDVNRIAMMLAEIYNAQIMYENEVIHVRDYFRRLKKLHLLAPQPDAVISKNIQNSKVARVYGCHMNGPLKDALEKYIKSWLLTVRDIDENGNKVLNLETIYSIGLLEELIRYNRDGNFDRVMSFGMLMFQLQEDDIGQEYDSSKKNMIAEDIKNFFKNSNMFNKRR